MTDDKERIDAAKWIFERTLGWIAAANVKIGAAIVIDTAMLGGLAAAFAGSDYHLRTAWVLSFSEDNCTKVRSRLHYSSEEGKNRQTMTTGYWPAAASQLDTAAGCGPSLQAWRLAARP